MTNYHLKKAALVKLNYNEFLNFFLYKDFPDTFKDNRNVFNKETYEKIKNYLRLLDYKSFLFWDEMFYTFEPIKVRKNLFSYDEDKLRVLKKMNNYLKNEETFNETKIKIKNINPKFIIGDIFDIKLNRTYDNILLSNLGQYYEIKEFKSLLDKLDNHLNINGKMLVSYLYQTKKDTEYKETYAKIYNLKETFKELDDYITSFESFKGIRGILHETNKIKDSVLIYKKTK